MMVAPWIDTTATFPQQLSEREERVLFVVDGDNIAACLRRDGIPIDWRQLRNVVHLACMRLQQAHPDWTSHTPVGPVTEAHFFFSVAVPFAKGEQGNARLTERRLARYAAEAARSFRDMGYTPHIHAKPYGEPGYRDEQVRDLIESRLAHFDTLILASCDNDFWDLLWRIRRAPRRVFYAATSTRRTSRWRIDNKIPFIDLATLQMVYTQTIFPRPQRRPASA